MPALRKPKSAERRTIVAVRFAFLLLFHLYRFFLLFFSWFVSVFIASETKEEENKADKATARKRERTSAIEM